jgi:hypothetical protein
MTFGTTNKVQGAAGLVTSEMIDTAERHLSYRLSHILVRLLALLNIGIWIIDIALPRYAHALANAPKNKSLVGWLFISTIALPLCTGVEVAWMRSVYGERRALWIDGILAAAWAAFFWIRVLYLFTHRVLF